MSTVACIFISFIAGIIVGLMTEGLAAGNRIYNQQQNINQLTKLCEDQQHEISTHDSASPTNPSTL